MHHYHGNTSTTKCKAQYQLGASLGKSYLSVLSATVKNIIFQNNPGQKKKMSLDHKEVKTKLQTRNLKQTKNHS